MGHITGTTKLIGLLLTPSSHSMAPTMYNAALSYLGLDYVYVAFNCGLEGLEAAVAGLKAIGARGFNVSMPNKAQVIKYLDRVEPNAALMGAVNTVVIDDGFLIGHNMDGIGYMWSLAENNVNIIGRKITVIGAGGGSAAICVQAAMDGVSEISIFNRRSPTFAVGEKLAENINNNTSSSARMYDLMDQKRLCEEIAGSVLLVDTTPVGMAPLEDSCNISDISMLRSDLVVSDIVYHPRKTKLLKLAEECGCKTINGLSMLLGQGAEGFKLWTGCDMPIKYVEQFMV